MKTNYEMVREFHRKFGATVNDVPTVLKRREVDLRHKLMIEELYEWANEVFDLDSISWEEECITNPNLTRVGKELADLLYVVYGTAAAYGLPIDDIFAEVHRSNMSKLDADGNVLRRADGKVLKGENYTPADIEGVLEAHANIA